MEKIISPRKGIGYCPIFVEICLYDIERILKTVNVYVREIEKNLEDMCIDTWGW